MPKPGGARLGAREIPTSSKGISRRVALGMIAFAAGVAGLDAAASRRGFAAGPIPDIHARVIAINIPGASAVAQVGTFLNNPQACARPIPTNFPSFIQPGAVLDPARLLVGSRSNFGDRAKRVLP
jgi:hypothetical protein